jgi:hypothetical protein
MHRIRRLVATAGAVVALLAMGLNVAQYEIPKDARVERIVEYSFRHVRENALITASQNFDLDSHGHLGGQVHSTSVFADGR